MADSASFSRFVVEEALPYIEQQYRVLNNKLLIGQSYSGHFMLQTLAKYPNAFDTMVTADTIIPSQSLLEQLKTDWQTIKHSKTRLIVTSSKKADFDTRLIQQAMAKSHPWRANPNAFSRKVFKGENHTSVYYAALNDGLRQHFADFRPPSATQLQHQDFDISAIDAYFERRDNKYQSSNGGSRAKSAINNIAHYYLEQKRFKLAFALFQHNPNKNYLNYIFKRTAQRFINQNDPKAAKVIEQQLAKINANRNSSKSTVHH